MIKILFNPKAAEHHPLELLIVGIFYSSLSLLLSLWIFPTNSSLVMVFLTVISCIYVIQGAIKLEEKLDKKEKDEKKRLRHHSKLLLSLLCLFIGFVISFSFWTIILPEKTSSIIFSTQASEIINIRSGVTGNSISSENLFIILLNNIKVLFVSLLFAIFYGAGAIFILAWNASILGFAIGDLAKQYLGLISLPMSFLKYFIHGVPEMLAYIIAALAGGILYIAFLKEDFIDPEKRKKIFYDILILIISSIIILFIAGLIEVYISPLV